MERDHTHVVLFSGGIGSWMAARRVRDTLMNLTDSLVLLFTDTRSEDEDLYRFLTDAATDVGGDLQTIADGRDLWELFESEGMIANTRADFCSRILKRDLARDWINTHVDPSASTIHMGVDWSEMHRFERARPRWEPYRLDAPLTRPPYLSKPDMLAAATARGLNPPRLYELGFPHNNCGGFCVKQGHAAFTNLLLRLPDRFAYHETKEQAFRESTGKDVAILRDRRGGDTQPFTLRQLRERVEASGDQMELGDDWGGCGCMVD